MNGHEDARQVNKEKRGNMKSCECGCGEMATGTFLPGHDQKLRIALEQEVGGLLSLRSLVEAARAYASGEISDETFCQNVRQGLK